MDKAESERRNILTTILVPQSDGHGKCNGTSLIMRVIALLTIVFALVSVAHPTLAKPPQTKKLAKPTFTASELFKRSSAAIVSIKTDTGTGTGFLIGDGYFVITCCHVIEGATEIKIQDSKGRSLNIGKVSLDKSTDTALLSVGKYQDQKSLKCVDTNSVNPGDPVVVIGNPLGFLSQTLTTGIVSAKRQDGNAKLIQIDATISPGSSGSPIIDAYGNVIGIVSFTFTKGQALNMGVACMEVVKAAQRGFRTYEQFVADNRASKKSVTAPQGSVDVAGNGGTGSTADVESNESDTAKETESLEATQRQKHEVFIKQYAQIIGDIYKPVVELNLCYSKWVSKDLTTNDLEQKSEHAYESISNTISNEDLAKIPDEYLSKSTYDSLLEFRKTVMYYTQSIRFMCTAFKDEQEGDYKASHKEMVAKFKLLHVSLYTIIDGLAQEKWFDATVFNRHISAPAYATLMWEIINTVIPEPTIEGRAVVGHAGVGSVLKAGDVITKIKAVTEPDWQPIENWKDVVVYLAEKKIQIAIITLSRDGKIVETTAVFHE